MAKKKKGGAEQKPGHKVVARNKDARRRFDIEETYEAGIVLGGTEVKAIRDGQVQIADAYAAVRGNELYLMNLHIGPYRAAGAFDQHDPRRVRKLLLRRNQIDKLRGKLTQKGYSLIPLDVHFANGWAKVELGLAIGKKMGDRREELRKKAHEREMQRHTR